MPRFTQGELEIMRILWERGELKPAEIHAHFPRRSKTLRCGPIWPFCSTRAISSAAG